MFSKLANLIRPGLRVLQGLALTALLVSPVRAAVVINEFLPNPSGPSSEDTEWIELYNSGPDSVDLTGWKLDDIDGGGSSPYTIASGSSIAASSFLVFEKSTTNIALNNTDDTVRLLNGSSTTIDSHDYSSTSQDISIGRTSNGGGSWITCTTPTKGSGNNCPYPTLTATSTPTKTPTQSPQVTNSPTTGVTSTPVPPKKLTPTQTPTPKKSPSPSPVTEEVSPSGTVLGVEISPSLVPATASAGLSHALPLIVGLLLVAIGLAILAFVLVWKKRNLAKLSQQP